LHGLRHSALTALSESGVPIATVSKYAGHSSPAFTASVYLIASDDSLAAASDALALALRSHGG
jgi:integrase